ncbi:MAG: type II toxin-antitoxin system RelB/DinJ family antitoxin [Candidatus Omnitrophica bacterium]|jgi:DNA-damage-inducible protein J|nr:type II toxin-antitoxin system RelB/DinJ family antitoxin [Candidatus Omnitrophota bacterium]
MAKTAMIRARTNEEIKTKAEKVLQQIGLNSSEAINIFYRQIILNNGLPFPVKIPNKTTLQTFKKTDAGKELNKYKTLDDFIKKLNVKP